MIWRNSLIVLVCSLLSIALSPVSGAAMQEARWSSLVNATWAGYKRLYIFCGEPCGNNLGLVFDPASQYEAVSEGVGYGLLMAVMMNDKQTFDVIYDAAHEVLLDDETGLFHWRADNQGNVIGRGSATDADQDIAAALIFAQRRVDAGEWVAHATRPYGERAHELIDAIWDYSVADGRYLKPGPYFGDGQNIVNLSYFSPAWYRLYDSFQETRRWDAVIDQGYISLNATPGAPRGLAPDWSDAEGAPAYPYCEQHGRPLEACSYDMRYEAVRVLWRVGLDCLWYGEPRACDWISRAAAFQRQQPDFAFARMYTLDGEPVVDYHDEAMLGMWLAGAVASGDHGLAARVGNLLQGRAVNAFTGGYWGDTSYYYYNQSLAWFGAALASGQFREL